MRPTRPGSSRSLMLAAVALIALAGALPARANGVTRAGQVAWVTHLQAVDAALARMDVGAAERAWQEAYVAALGSWRWDGMLEVAHWDVLDA